MPAASTTTFALDAPLVRLSTATTRARHASRCRVTVVRTSICAPSRRAGIGQGKRSGCDGSRINRPSGMNAAATTPVRAQRRGNNACGLLRRDDLHRQSERLRPTRACRRISSSPRPATTTAKPQARRAGASRDRSPSAPSARRRDRPKYCNQLRQRERRAQAGPTRPAECHVEAGASAGYCSTSTESVQPKPSPGWVRGRSSRSLRRRSPPPRGALRYHGGEVSHARRIALLSLQPVLESVPEAARRRTCGAAAGAG